MPDHECPCNEMLRLRNRVEHLEGQTEADSSAMHILYNECLEARKALRESELKCKCLERGLIP